MRLTWQHDTTTPDLARALAALSKEYPDLTQNGAGAPVRFVPDPERAGPSVTATPDGVTIRYGTTAHALRGLGTALADLVPESETHEETFPFPVLGVMLDCSRNAIMTPDHLKRWMRQLALLGYNMLMLYTEETYELPGEPYFGYQRGRYTERELRDLDDYATTLGIELIGCIQTLGHLEQLIKWSAYWAIKDTESVLLVDDDRTYALIEKMIALFAKTYRSRRIHLGMDETHDLGRGRFMNLYGYERGYDIFNRHLARVVAICRKHGLEPLIWSDMYFRMGSRTGNYYDPEIRIPDDVARAIPKDVQLVYWDYSHDDQAFYEDWIARHRQLGFEPVMGSGVQTSKGNFWYGRRETESSVTPCLRACRATGVREVFFTLWADDGAFCEFDSALAGLAWAAEVASAGDAPVDDDALARRFRAVCRADYAAIREAAALQQDMVPSSLFWDDPLLRIYWRNETVDQPDKWSAALKRLNGLRRRLRPALKETEPVDFAHWAELTSFLCAKMRYHLALEKAYATRDVDELESLRKQALRMIPRLERCHRSLRRQWMRRNKPNGFEVLQLRIGGQKQRWTELAERLGELVNGQTSGIPELDEPVGEKLTLNHRWWRVASSSFP